MEAPEDERSGGPDDVADSTAGQDSHDAENYQSSGESGSDSEESEPETAEERAARAEHYKSLGNDAYVQKEYDDSYEYYTQAVELAPENAVYLSNRAASLVALQRYNEALADSRKATEVEPGYSKGWIRLATCHLKVGDFEACENVLTQAYLRDTRNGKIAAARRKLATAQETLQQIRTQLDGGEHSGALQSLLELQNLCPGWSHLMILRVEALIGMRKYAAAYAITTDMLRKNASNSDALYWRAQALYFQGDFEKAVKHMQQVMRRDPDNAKCQKVIKQMRKLEKTKARGNQLFKSRDWNGAITAYTECLEIDPDNVLFNAKLLCNRAAALGYLNRHRDVIRDCNKAIDADPRYAKAYIRRAGAFKNIGGVENIERCIDDLKRVSEIAGSSSPRLRVRRSTFVLPV